MFEKSQIRDTLGLLRIYHKSNDDTNTDTDTSAGTDPAADARSRRDSVNKCSSARKRLKANQDLVG